MKKKEETVNSTLRLPASLHKQLSDLAWAKRLSMAQAVVEAVAQYVKRETKGGK
jgi:predicted transcriptional regulator